MNLSPEASEFLKTHYVGVISTVSPGGEPWNTVVYYVADNSGDIFFFTKNQTKKYDNLAQNPKVAFVVYDAEHRITTQISGRASVVEDQMQINQFFDRIDQVLDIESHPLPIEKLRDAGNYTVIKITPVKISFSDYSKPVVDHS